MRSYILGHRCSIGIGDYIRISSGLYKELTGAKVIAEDLRNWYWRDLRLLPLLLLFCLVIRLSCSGLLEGNTILEIKTDNGQPASSSSVDLSAARFIGLDRGWPTGTVRGDNQRHLVLFSIMLI